VFMTEFPRGRDTICPPWCERPADHVNSTDYQDQKHLRTVAQIGIPEIDGIRSDSEKPITVWLEAWVDWDWKEWPAVITVSLSDSGASDDEQDLMPSEARALAAALQQAADLLEGARLSR
jgi:hypothetical protein